MKTASQQINGKLNQVQKTFLTFIFIGISAGSFALSQPVSAELELSLWNGQSFEIEFDRKQYQTDEIFSLVNIRPGVHHITVYQHFTNSFGFSRRVNILFRGEIELKANERTYAEITSYRRFRVLRTEHLSPAVEVDSVHLQDENPVCPYEEHVHHNSGASEQELILLIDRMSQAWFDRDRLRMASSFLLLNSVHSQDIRVILDTFDFDSTKLEFAKSAFPFVKDPQKYFIVNEAFIFDSSARELNFYIRG